MNYCKMKSVVFGIMDGQTLRGRPIRKWLDYVYLVPFFDVPDSQQDSEKPSTLKVNCPTCIGHQRV